MEKYVLPDYMYDSIDNGLIFDNIEKILNDGDIYKGNEIFQKYEPIFLKYAKAYMVYVISGYIIDNDKTIKNPEVNFSDFESDPKKVYDELLVLIDIIKKAGLSKADVQAKFLKSQIDYNNLKNYKNDPRIKKLSLYNEKIYEAIKELSETQKFDISISSLIRHTKYYILLTSDNDELSFIGDKGFLKDMVSAAYYIYEESKVEYDDRMNDRNQDLAKLNDLSRIIKKHNF